MLVVNTDRKQAEETIDETKVVQAPCGAAAVVGSSESAAHPDALKDVHFEPVHSACPIRGGKDTPPAA
jgi:hypothetical protein